VPIYEYVCDTCRHQFEVKQKMNDPPLSVCDRCGNSITKVISAPAIMFKGTGWYVTDYSNKMKAPAQAEGAPTNGNKDSKPESKPPSSPATGEASTPASTPSSSSTTTSESSPKSAKTERSKPSS